MPIVLAGHSPRLIIKSSISSGQLKYGGTVGHFMHLMSEHLNLSYEYIKNGSTQFSVYGGIDYVNNGKAELSTGIHFSQFSNVSSVAYSYPVELNDWCMMLPLPADVPRSHFFVIIISLPVFIVTLATVVLISMLLSLALHRHGQKGYVSEIFLHDACLRGILVQSFAEVHRPTLLIRGIYVKICLLGLMLPTYYNAFFCTFLTKSPKEPPLLTIDALYHANIKVMGLAVEIEVLLTLHKDLVDYSSVFIKEPNVTRFAELRDTLDTNYGYMVPLEKWKVVQEQQKWFTKKLFYRPYSLCVLKTVPMTIPIDENSYFTLKFNQFLLQIHQMGVWNYWQKSLYYELVANKDIIFGDRIEMEIMKPIKVEDMQYIFMGMVFMLCLSSLIYLVELLTFHHSC